MPEHLPDRCQPGAVAQQSAARAWRSRCGPTLACRPQAGPLHHVADQVRPDRAERGLAGQEQVTGPRPGRATEKYATSASPTSAGSGSGPHGVLCPARRSRRSASPHRPAEPGHLDRAQAEPGHQHQDRVVAHAGTLARRVLQQPLNIAGAIVGGTEAKRQPPTGGTAPPSLAAVTPLQVKEPHQRPQFGHPSLRRARRDPGYSRNRNAFKSAPVRPSGANTPPAIACSARNRRAVFS